MAKKKTFNLQNPALQFISTQTNPTEQSAMPKAPEGYKQNPIYIEKKNSAFAAFNAAEPS